VPSEWGIRAQLRNAYRAPTSAEHVCNLSRECPVLDRPERTVRMVNLALDAGLTFWTADTAERSIDEIETLDSAGRRVLRLTSGGAGGAVQAWTCDALLSLDSVRSAYGVGAVGKRRLANGSLVTTQGGTAGIYGYLGLQPVDDRGPWVITGATVSERNGFVDGGWLMFEPGSTSPSARYRATRVCTQRRDTPWSRATSLLERPSRTTAVITTRAIDIAHHPICQGVNDVARHLRTMS